jgi:hypothetical protein
VLASVQVRGKQLAGGLAALGKRHGIVETRGAGLLWAAGLAHSRAADVAQAAMEIGLLVNAPRADTLRFMPSLRVSESEIEEALMLLAQALNTAKAIAGPVNLYKGRCFVSKSTGQSFSLCAIGWHATQVRSIRHIHRIFIACSSHVHRWYGYGN